MERKRAEVTGLATKEGPAGVFRTTLSYNAASMACHFHLKSGARIPLHSHEALQHGYVVRGRIDFLGRGGERFEARAGSSYLFDPWEEHGAEALEESEVVDFFVPIRPEYADN